MYTEEHDGSFTQGWSSLDSDPEKKGIGEWAHVLQTYYNKNPKLRSCPMAMEPSDEDGNPKPYCGGTFVAWGPLEARHGILEGEWGSYGINNWVYNPSAEMEDPPGYIDSDPAGRFWRTTHTRTGNEIPLLLDCFWKGGSPKHTDAPPRNDGYARLDGTSSGIARFCLNRHNGFINAAFVDFSVRKIRLTDLWNQKWSRSWYYQTYDGTLFTDFNKELSFEFGVPSGYYDGWLGKYE